MSDTDAIRIEAVETALCERCGSPEPRRCLVVHIQGRFERLCPDDFAERVRQRLGPVSVEITPPAVNGGSRFGPPFL